MSTEFSLRPNFHNYYHLLERVILRDLHLNITCKLSYSTIKIFLLLSPAYLPESSELVPNSTHTPRFNMLNIEIILHQLKKKLNEKDEDFFQRWKKWNLTYILFLFCKIAKLRLLKGLLFYYFLFMCSKLHKDGSVLTHTNKTTSSAELPKMCVSLGTDRPFPLL